MTEKFYVHTDNPLRFWHNMEILSSQQVWRRWLLESPSHKDNPEMNNGMNIPASAPPEVVFSFFLRPHSVEM